VSYFDLQRVCTTLIANVRGSREFAGKPPVWSRAPESNIYSIKTLVLLSAVEFSPGFQSAKPASKPQAQEMLGYQTTKDEHCSKWKRRPAKKQLGTELV
jgi:hypothetical protein